MAKKTTKVKEVKNPKVCSKCGTENDFSLTQCKDCQGEKFEPEWVLAKEKINRQTSVQITLSSAQYGTPSKRLTLSKWWVGGRQSFNISQPGHWEQIRKIIDEKLAPKLGWKSSAALLDQIKTSKEKNKSEGANELVLTHPQILKDLLSHIDFKKLSPNDIESLGETLTEISDITTNANAGFRETFLSLLKKLPTQKQRALEDLDMLLKGWNLNVITNVAQQVRSRLDTIELFEQQINDPRTLEITGDNSIHRILERSMWIIDEKYWLLHSNKTLLKSIGDELELHNKKLHGKKRPDFVCGSVGDRLVILELKRPAHELTVEDLNQLETYIVIAEKHYKFSTFSAYLVGKSVSPDLKQRLKLRGGGFNVLLYSNIIEDTKKRYQEYLDSVD